MALSIAAWSHVMLKDETVQRNPRVLTKPVAIDVNLKRITGIKTKARCRIDTTFCPGPSSLAISESMRTLNNYGHKKKKLFLLNNPRKGWTNDASGQTSFMLVGVGKIIDSLTHHDSL